VVPENESAVYALIRSGIALREAGQRADARSLLQGLVAQVQADDDGFAKVFLAHSLADVQDDPAEELLWDEQALALMDEVTDAKAVDQGVPGGRKGLYPSLHLNLAVSYRRVGDDHNAERHFQEGRSYLAALGDDEYSRDIKSDYAEGLDAHIERLTHASD
jgi:hypothetical protein